ncbi:Alpha/Beta hydrolase protein [Blyttiomyces helicus]|uniref:Alpha/Beta hydrolase protein n=1 Tax=Blyttiomyces helicus TaxID=388810 RepID=A0A4P9WCF4_9FUNG|nr:Alpha/Beta hydrolase protein [Blyttiomyces helicus]|eukprot:RKO90341.1 Alpha/Beta hydrolase protein [Blyttiomyces helicus]
MKQPLAVSVAATAAVGGLIFFIARAAARKKAPEPPTDSDVERWAVVRGKRLHVVFHEHAAGREVPTLVLIHGLGGQIGQWDAQIAHFCQVANVLAIEWVGNGKSDRPLGDADYETRSIVEDIADVLDGYKEKLISHSYGCVLASHLYPLAPTSISAMIFIAPKGPPSAHEIASVSSLLKLPTPIVNIFRYFDRRGGVNSKSVNRMLGKKATAELRERQLVWNRENETGVLKRVLKGATWPTQDTYKQITCPVLLIGGSADHVTPLNINLELIHSWLGSSPTPVIVPEAGHIVMAEEPDVVNAVMHNWLIECGLSKTLLGPAAADPGSI